MTVKVKLLRPLDGMMIGSEVTYSEADAKRLEKRGAVEIIGGKKAAPAPANKMAEPPANKDMLSSNVSTKRKT